MITTLTDGMAILAIRYRFFDLLWSISLLAGMFLAFVVLPLAILAWGIWALFLKESDESLVVVPTPPTVQAPVSATDANRAPAEPRPVQPPTPSVYAAANATLLESVPPDTRAAHLRAARTAVAARGGTAATYHIKMVMQYDLQKGRELSKDIRDVMRDAVMMRANSSDIGNFVTLASEKYKSQWSGSDQRTYEMMRSIANRVRN